MSHQGHFPQQTMAGIETPLPEPEPRPIKRCSHCHEWLSPDQFSIDRSRPDGHSRRCRDCMGFYFREWRARRAADASERQSA